MTAILPISISHPDDNTAPTHVYLTGSYDDNLRILSVPNGTTVRQPRVLHEVGLGGGVWRIKMLKSSTVRMADTWEYSATLLVSCMYAGAKGVEIKGVAQTGSEGLDGGASEWTWTSREAGKMEEHESMCYACDVQAEDEGEAGLASGGGRDGQSRGDRMVVSCSFYDKRLCLWKWPGVEP